MEKHILIVDDSKVCQIIARESLNEMGSIEIVDTYKEAHEKCSSKKYDLLIIDLFLSDGNGIELLSEIKKMPHNQKAYSIMITSDDDISKKVAAFSVGADDFVVKPYVKLELKVRAKRLFARAVEDEKFCDSTSGVCVNSLSYKASVKSGDSFADLNLTPHEFKILNILIRNPDRIFSRDQLIDIVWGTNTFLSERTVDTHVSTLRKKLGNNSEMLCCVRGIGYKWHEKFKDPA